MRKEYLDWGQVENLIERLLSILPRDYDAILAVTRGGLVPASLLSYRMGVRTIMIAVETPPSAVDELFGRPTFLQFPADPLIKGKRLLVVDSAWGTSQTLQAVKNRVEAAGGKPETCVLHFRPRGIWGETRPDYYAEETDAWVIYPWEPPETSTIPGPGNLPG
jgi:hypoxanthine phosphoribosyltransferase